MSQCFLGTIEQCRSLINNHNIDNNNNHYHNHNDNKNNKSNNCKWSYSGSFVCRLMDNVSTRRGKEKRSKISISFQGIGGEKKFFISWKILCGKNWSNKRNFTTGQGLYSKSTAAIILLDPDTLILIVGGEAANSPNNHSTYVALHNRLLDSTNSNNSKKSNNSSLSFSSISLESLENLENPALVLSSGFPNKQDDKRQDKTLFILYQTNSSQKVFISLEKETNIHTLLINPEGNIHLNNPYTYSMIEDPEINGGGHFQAQTEYNDNPSGSFKKEKERRSRDGNDNDNDYELKQSKPKKTKTFHAHTFQDNPYLQERVVDNYHYEMNNRNNPGCGHSHSPGPSDIVLLGDSTSDLFNFSESSPTQPDSLDPHFSSFSNQNNNNDNNNISMIPLVQSNSLSQILNFSTSNPMPLNLSLGLGPGPVSGGLGQGLGLGLSSEFILDPPLFPSNKDYKNESPDMLTRMMVPYFAFSIADETNSSFGNIEPALL